MPARLNTQTRVVQGNRTIIVGTDEGWRFGPVEGRWYIGMLIFAVIILLYNLAWPWFYESATGRSWRFRQQTTQTTVVNPRPIVIPPVIVQQAPPPAVSAPVPSVSAELSPEELDRRHTEFLRSHGR